MKKYLKEYRTNSSQIKKYYSYLVNLTKEHYSVGVTNEWIVDNYYMLVEQEKSMNEFFARTKEYNNAFKKTDLPKVSGKFLKQYNYKIELKALMNVLNTHQDNYDDYFPYKVIATLPKVLYCLVVRELSNLCTREFERINEQKKATLFIEEIKNNKVKRENVKFDTDILTRPVYLEKIYNGLKEQGELTISVFEKLKEVLENNSVNLNELFEAVYEESAKDSVLVSNLFSSLAVIAKIKCNKLYANLSKTEKTLLMDESYTMMTSESKELYRKQVHINAKKKHMKEHIYAKEILALSLNEQKHIGFYLFKKPRLKLRRGLYVTYITLITIALSIFASFYLFEPQWLAILLLIIPTSEIVVQLTNKILMKFYHAEPLPKLDYTDGIPKESATMVVIATIIKSEEKVKKMFETLETYYLANKSDNLYFTLLGDCASNKEENASYDDEVIKALEKYSSLLNKKYGNIFNYVYRRRIFSNSEDCYLGWERKRGGLQNLNQLLLHKLDESEQKRLFQATSLSDFEPKIKYIITLDTDTKLVLKTAHYLIGAMAHPLNKPILNAAKDKVIEGYGLMQPRVSIDIESSNKTTFTQVYAGIGGFDIYNSVIPSFYQDVFNEGSFVGKGIYDLEVFDQVLTNRFPTDLILSHDLLEGNYVRCAFASDIEVIDDFPSGFLVDATRRHRWARGDMQIFSWVFKKPLNAIEHFKIFDNIRRGLLELSLLFLIIFIHIFGTAHPLIWVIYICFTIILPIIYYVIDNLKFQKESSTRTKQYVNIVIGFRSLIIRALSSFSSIPYNAKLYVDAFIKAIYRMTISKKNLLNWLTAEEAEKTVKNDFDNYLKQFRINYVVTIILLMTTIIFNPSYVGSALLISLVFVASPLIFYLMGMEHEKDISKLNKKEKESFKQLSIKTWNYFADLLTAENNYLIPDNYQINRDIKEDYKTSPTDISFSLISLISANELELTTTKKCINMIERIITSVESLEKWNGHLYNWYNIKTKDVLPPYQISTVDSGNFIAALMVVVGFLDKHDEKDLSARVKKLIDETNFAYLYKRDQDVFACSYDTISEQLNYYNYNKFASESRLTSFIAIAKGDILPKHWFLLDKTLTKFRDYKGLLSWSGTSFEYFMPLIYMKDYTNTLIDESYYFSYYCQKEYMEEVNPNLPWGISESAYNVLDDAKNYKYQAFGTPYLRFHDPINERVVIAPYASLLVTPKQPKEVYNNYLKYKKIGMEGKYGLYESYDVEDQKQVFSYYAHHQGMILASLTNYLKDNVIQDYFYQDVRVKSFDILNKEKMQIKPMIDSKVNKYKKYIYEKEIIPNDIRCYDHLKERPEVSVLSNSRYTTLINDYGNGFSRYKTIQLNRYRKISENDYGMYLYIKDLDNDKIWSNTYAPTNVKPDRYEVTFALDEIKFVRHDEDIITKTEIIVSKEYNAEIRKITFRNMSDEAKHLELTSYFEPIISENADDIGHRVFNGFAIKSSYDEETNSIILERNLRNAKDKHYVINKLLVLDAKDKYTYETERSNFLNRNDKYELPAGLSNKLTNYTGDNIDPITSMRNQVVIEPKEKTVCYIINGFGKSKDQVLDIVNSYKNSTAIDDAFKLSAIMTLKNITNQNLPMSDVNLYNKALNYLYQTSKIHLSDERKNYLLNNKMSQRNLWRFGVSGDRPIILVEINDITGLGITSEILKMFEYYKTIGIYVDVVMLNSGTSNYAKVITDTINKNVNDIYATNNFNTTPGSVNLLEKSNVTDEELNLLRAISRLKFDIQNNASLRDCIENMQTDNAIFNYEKIEELVSEKIEHKEPLEFDNSYGGFSKDGKEYVITNPNTPTPWSNVLCNNEFGTIITNNDNGFTYAFNSREFKLTSWTNDVILDDKSEMFRINNKILNWNTCKHGFGYTTFMFKNDDYDIDITYFVPPSTKVKLAKMNIKSYKKSDATIDYLINPVLGTNEDKTTRHIVDQYDEKNNLFILQNKYSDIYNDKCVYLSSSEKISDYVSGAVARGISINLSTSKEKTKTVYFMLGVEDNAEEVINVVRNLTANQIETEYKNTIKYWNDVLTIFQVETPDKSFDYMMNGWLLYQTLASRVMARTGFYQVGGAFGFRDQLQDCTNICMIHPELTRKQILNCARHQFEEGDVLHWWHPGNKFGSRTRFKDDYLWLIYATSEYLRVTNDKSILDEQISFAVGQKLNDGDEERGMEYTHSANTTSLYEHLKLVIDKAFKEIGTNGLPLMGGGDWNDGMNHIGIKGKGTSVWLGFFMYTNVNRFIDIVKIVEPDAPVERYQRFNEQLKVNILKNAWDSKYYLRAINDDGIKIGSSSSKECQIDLISQSFAILTDIASLDQTASIIKSVDEKLVDQENGLIKLLTPAFTNSWIDPGYIKNYPKGIRENGGQYTHACAWYIEALEHIGEKEKAYEYFKMLNPINHGLTKEKIEKYKVEPYVIAADIYSNKYFAGRGGWTWYTGSSGWFYKVGLESILGIEKNGDTLIIKPNIPTNWDKIKIRYRYIDTVYEITIMNDSIDEIELDNIIQENSIPLINDLKKHEVIVKRCCND